MLTLIQGLKAQADYAINWLAFECVIHNRSDFHFHLHRIRSPDAHPLHEDLAAYLESMRAFGWFLSLRR